MKRGFEKLYLIVTKEDAERICETLLLKEGDVFIPDSVLNQVLKKSGQTFEEWLHQNTQGASLRCIVVEALLSSGPTHKVIEKNGTVGVWWCVCSEIPLMSCTEVLPLKRLN